jgi:hypothetical protein
MPVTLIDRTLTPNVGRRRSALGSVMRKTDHRSPRLKKYSVTDVRGAIMSDVIVWIAISGTNLGPVKGNRLARPITSGVYAAHTYQ